VYTKIGSIPLPRAFGIRLWMGQDASLVHGLPNAVGESIGVLFGLKL
jgi:hypothetical protein